ncbi:hypothetical protein, partial [Thiolapillus sp.]|uniref:hypothetical protein n=1 Tax=Thiolapillus sp. TaxID=2017437 RepID=UPI003AF6287D
MRDIISTFNQTKSVRRLINPKVISREEKATSTRLTDKIFMKLLSNPIIIKTALIGLELCIIIQRYELISKTR